MKHKLIETYNIKTVAKKYDLQVEDIKALVLTYLSIADEFKDDLYHDIENENFDNVYILSEHLYGATASLYILDALVQITVVKDTKDKVLSKKHLDKYYDALEHLKLQVDKT